MKNMTLNDIHERTATHPCYSESAHNFFARMHLAVAPKCNIQCNYCNRKYDCSNESRPGVVSERLSPMDALSKVYFVAERVRELSVIGIAGPGDALANPDKTFATVGMIREHFPDLALCLSTNGLALPEYADDLADAGVGHVTVTVNTLNPSSAQRIYEWVLIDGKKRSDPEAMAHFLERQQEGVRALVRRNVLVKVNSVLIPGINDKELPELSRRLKTMGVFLHNVMPLVAKAEHGTRFGLEGRTEPTFKEVEDIREKCGDIKMMSHCRQCRADAVGRLGEDRFMEFSGKGSHPSPQSSTHEGRGGFCENGAAARDEWRRVVAPLVNPQISINPHLEKERGFGNRLFAVCTKGLGMVNEHFGHAKEFHIYRVSGGGAKLINVRKVSEKYCSGPQDCGDEEDRLDRIIRTIEDCKAVLCMRIGHGPKKILEEKGIEVVEVVPGVSIETAVMEAAAGFSVGRAAPACDRWAQPALQSA